MILPSPSAKNMKKINLVFVLLMFGFGCTAMRTSLVGDPGEKPNPEEMKVRYLKVALIGEEQEPSREFVAAVVGVFGELRRKVGIDIGAYTYYQVSLDGAKSMKQIFERLYEWHAPMNSRAFDIGLCYTGNFLAEDAAGIAMTLVGMPVFTISTADPSAGRFAVIRGLGTIEHEVSHLFCAMDGWSDADNRRIVLKHKWRRYDGRYMGLCENFEKAYSDTRDPNVWGDRYPEVVERAKERGARKLAELYKKNPCLDPASPQYKKCD